VKKKILLAFFVCGLPATTLAAPISDIGIDYVSNFYSSGIFGWNSSYDISFQNQNLILDIDIDLIGDDPGSALISTWEQGIESIWSNAFDIYDGTYLYDTVFNVDWVNSGADHTVTVHSGSGAVNMTNWYTDNPSGWPNNYHDEIAAHEFGHMFGLYDEYIGGAVNPLTGLIRPDSIMGQNLTTPHTDHYTDLTGWLSLNSGISLSLVTDSGDHYYNISSVPEPETYAMLMAGLGLLGFMARRRKESAV